jgi:F-type H+-transporting ATPase subunit delta
MANFLNQARPYALAAFEYARDKQQLPAWKAFLTSAAYVAREASVRPLLSNPQMTSAKSLDLFTSVLSDQLDVERKNFLSLLALNNRLIALPEVADVFNAYVAAYEKMRSVRVITAIEINDAYKQKLTQALIKRTKEEVTLHCEIDPTLLGGAIIHIGDRVIDGSVRGKLNRMLEAMSV